jgi:hypothetical protein
MAAAKGSMNSHTPGARSRAKADSVALRHRKRFTAWGTMMAARQAVVAWR